MASSRESLGSPVGSDSGVKHDDESVSLVEEGSRKPAPAADELKPASAPAAPTAQSQAPLSQALPAIAFWIAMSCATILFNKYLYTGTFAHPLTLTTIHMAFATVATTVLRLTGRLTVPSLGADFYVKNVLPIGILFAFSLGFSNLAALRLSVSFIQMVKALTPMLTLAISVAMSLERFSQALGAIVSVMCVGVGIASYGEIEFDTVGLLLQLASITAEAARLVATQSLLQSALPKGTSPLVSISLFAPCSLLFLFPVALWAEPGALSHLMTAGVGPVVFANACTAFTLNAAVVVLVSQTSGLTLTLAGIVKDVMLIVASIWLFGNPITHIQVFGYTLALYGLNMYHGYRKGMGGVINLQQLAKEAATDRVMMTMGAGMLALLLVSRSG